MVETLGDDLLASLLRAKDPTFWRLLSDRTLQTKEFPDLISLCTLRRRAVKQNIQPLQAQQKIRVAMIGGYTLYPLSELLIHFLHVDGFDAELWSGQYDSYAAEVLDRESDLHSFAPDVIVFLPPYQRYTYSGTLLDEPSLVQADLESKLSNLKEFCHHAQERSNSFVVLCNFMLPSGFDPGPWRSKSPASEWNFLKRLNTEIGLNMPDYVGVCDVEFLAARFGGAQARDDRAWFESKQPYSADFSCMVAREISLLIHSQRTASKKVLVMDLDDTLWSGIIGEDGLSGIELGSNTARGECFVALQRFIRQLKARGILLAVCSKNDHDIAQSPFESHPEMLLRLEDLAAFKANWQPKSQNIVEIAQELNLGLDSIVFIDDNPAEIELIHQMLPEVSALWLGRDPAEYVQKLQDCRWFEPRQLTSEDAMRTAQYQQEKNRAQLLSRVSDMDQYLQSLEMEMTLSEFNGVDMARVTQLINKSNQFNLTTKRRTESEVSQLMGPDRTCLSLRLKDKFGDLGLVSAIIAVPGDAGELVIDTWVMSCRVLKRQVEHCLMNELVKQACKKGIKRLVGKFIASGKNEMVRGLYEQLGFQLISDNGHEVDFVMSTETYVPFDTKIQVLWNSGVT